tara:strand:- start:59 stop:289 length:231 start_codon:yes stop_codon:yes gene_type:complete
MNDWPEHSVGCELYQIKNELLPCKDCNEMPAVEILQSAARPNLQAVILQCSCGHKTDGFSSWSLAIAAWNRGDIYQ